MRCRHTGEQVLRNQVQQEHYQKINSEIEKNLSRYNREDTVTSDYYKDMHRKEIYDRIGFRAFVV